MRSVVRQERGVYCLKLDATAKNVVASLGPGAPVGSGVISGGIVGPEGTGLCPDGSDVFVITVRTDWTDRVDAPFYVVVH